MRPEARQTTIYDFIEEKDWIDKIYYVFKTYHNCEWSEYSPKFLTKEDAKEWRMGKGEQLSRKFGRVLKLFTCRPADHNEAFYIEYQLPNSEPVTKLVPGEDFFDACDNLQLFMPEVINISLGFKK